MTLGMYEKIILDILKRIGNGLTIDEITKLGNINRRTSKKYLLELEKKKKVIKEGKKWYITI